MEEIRVRLAPSPTGPLHIGTARTGLFNWLFARQNKGKFILRIENTDPDRSQEKYVTDMVEALAWLSLDWDEGPNRKEPYGPYRQSERLDIYQKYAQQLLASKLAYYCYCTPKELAQERQTQITKRQPPKYSGRCRNLSQDQIAQYQREGRPRAIRFQVESKEIQFLDLIRGKISFKTDLFGDFIILKSDGNPTFIFAGAIDDFLMKISHVIRGEDHLSNTPRQILLEEALNFSLPEYGHLPLILNPDKTKLSKRKNPTSITADFRNQGYLPEAMINFMALMGWASKTGQEIFTLKELINEFNLADVGKSPAIFDATKLDYLNGYYLRNLQVGELTKRALPFLKKTPFGKDKKKLLIALSLNQERLKNFSEIPQKIDYFFQKPSNFKSILVPKGSTVKKTQMALKESFKYLSQEKDFGRDSLEQLLRAVAKKINLKDGEVLWPIRVALTGKTASPGTFEILEVLGKKESLERIQKAIDMIQ